MKKIDIDDVMAWIVEEDNLSDVLIRVFEYSTSMHDMSYLKAVHGLYGYSDKVLIDAYKIIKDRGLSITDYDEIEVFYKSQKFKDIVDTYSK